jgi:hypothetical protein
MSDDSDLVKVLFEIGRRTLEGVAKKGTLTTKQI